MAFARLFLAALAALMVAGATAASSGTTPLSRLDPIEPALTFAACLFGNTCAPPEWERLYLDQPNPGRIFEHLAFYTSRPHIAGTSDSRSRPRRWVRIITQE